MNISFENEWINGEGQYLIKTDDGYTLTIYAEPDGYWSCFGFYGKGLDLEITDKTDLNLPFYFKIGGEFLSVKEIITFVKKQIPLCYEEAMKHAQEHEEYRAWLSCPRKTGRI